MSGLSNSVLFKSSLLHRTPHLLAFKPSKSVRVCVFLHQASVVSTVYIQYLYMYSPVYKSERIYTYHILYHTYIKNLNTEQFVCKLPFLGVLIRICKQISKSHVDQQTRHQYAPETQILQSSKHFHTRKLLRYLHPL